MDKDNVPVVSFCIPVYNNAEGAVKIVNALLESEDLRCEVVVSDDASTDNVRELLAGINDCRFRYYRNDCNLGAHKNWEHSLELGRGEWLYLIMGRDMIHGENVSALIERLMYASENGITFLKDNGHNREGFSISEGINAIINFIKYNHPTGCIFKAELFRVIPNRTRYFEIADMYPELYVMRDLLMKGKGAFIHSGVNYGGFVTNKAEKKSTVEQNRDIYKAYFAPARKTRQFFEQLDMIEKDLQGAFTQEELDKYFKHRFTTLLEHVSYWWRMWCRDAVQMAHYGYEVRHIGIPEMVRNMLKAYNDTKSHIQETGTYTPQRHNIMILCTTKAIIHVSIKSAIRAVIEPLGIWKILHFFRNY